MITLIIIIAVGLYLLELLFLMIGLKKANRVSIIGDFEPAVSVIVAARNEEHVIRECIESLLKIEYPAEKLEIIIVNDSSTDGTPEIVRSYCDSNRGLKMVSTNPGKGNLRGKSNAISHGIEASIGEILMFTDADCRVPASWVRETVKYFDKSTGIVGGFTLLDADNWFEGMQSLDWIFLFGLASSTAGWKIPLTVIGNNFSIRRLAYSQTGGMANIPFSVTEDYALVQAVLRRTEYEIRFPVNPLALVRSRACHNMNHLFRQKQRWGVGGLDAVPRGFIITAIGWAAKMTLLLTLTISFWHIWLSAAIIMLLAETLFITEPLRKLGIVRKMKYFPPFLFYFFLYVLIIPFVAYFSKKIVWKERHL